MFIKNLFRSVFDASFVMLFLLLNFSCNQGKTPVKIPKEGGDFITQDLSKRLINNFQRKYRASRFPFVSTLSIKYVSQLLQAPNLRIYYGEDVRQNTVNLILVAADSSSRDITARTYLAITRDSVKLIEAKTAIAYTRQFQKHYRNFVDFPFAEKFQCKFLIELLSRKDVDRLSIFLGNDAENSIDKRSKKVKMIVFAVSKTGELVFNSSHRRNGLQSAAPDFLMVNYNFDDVSGVEYGQQCPNMCDMKSALYLESNQ